MLWVIFEGLDARYSVCEDDNDDYEGLNKGRADVQAIGVQDSED
jgi:hypothetical protein